MNFKYIVRVTKREMSKTNQLSLKQVINQYMEYYNEAQDKDSNISLDDLMYETRNDIENYIKSNNSFSIKTGIIEYFLNKRIYSSSKCNVNNAYNEIIKEEEDGKINLDDYSKDTLEYTYNFDENTKILVCAILENIRSEKQKAKKILKQYEELKYYRTASKKEINSIIKKITKGQPEKATSLKKIIDFVNKDERELVETEYRSYTKKSSEKLREECIKSIVENIKLIDKYSDLRTKAKGTNELYEAIYLSNYSFSYEESIEALSEKKLQSLKPEQLVALASFWNNRASKVIEDINSTLYILSNKQLYKLERNESGRLDISISDENLKAIDTKINILHKLSFDLFDDVIEQNEYTEDGIKMEDFNEIENNRCTECEDEYREYFDTLLPDIDNSLKNDMEHARLFENLSYNNYRIKTLNVQALLISVLNNENQLIKNFGYIQDIEANIEKKRLLLLGFDVVGMNMPLRLHVSKDIVFDILNGTKGEEAELPPYIGADDFMFSKNMIMTTRMYFPVSKEKKAILKENAKRVSSKDRYGKTIKHLYYIAEGGKMPEHMIEEMERRSNEARDNSELDF